MATRTTTTVLCDNPHHARRGREVPAVVTRTFTVAGKAYQTDLCADHDATFGQSFAPFVKAARPASKPVRVRVSRTVESRKRSKVIRAWAVEHGLEPGDRGRLPVVVVREYEKAVTGRD